MSQGSPVRFLWGTFCRQAIINRDDGELSVIGALPGLKMSLRSGKVDLESTEKVALDLGVFYIAAVFERTALDSREDQVSTTLNVNFVSAGTLLESFALPITIGSGDTSSVSVVKVERLLLSRPTVVGENLFYYEIQYRFEDCDLGVVRLPVITDTEIVEE